MSLSPTYVTLHLKPEDQDHILYLIGDSIPSLAFTVIDTQDEQVFVGTVIVLPHQERRLTLALSAPLTPQMIEDIYFLVKIGLLLGFVVRGEIDLGGKVINNLGKLSEQSSLGE